MKKETNEALTNDNMGMGEKLAFMIKRINCGLILSLSYCGAYSKTLHFSYCHQTNDGGTITTQGVLVLGVAIFTEVSSLWVSYIRVTFHN